MGKKLQYILSEIKQFLTNRRFIYNILGILLFLTIVIWGILTWLKVYTNHGQEIALPNYIGQHITEATAKAKDASFEIIVNDSVHIVGKDGGIIQTQNPAGGALVKEKRKIYVMVTKHVADIVDLSTILLYGQPFEMKKAALERKGIKTKIRSYKYDQADNVILEMWQGDDLLVSNKKSTKGIKVKKGSTVEFVISRSDGGSVVLPNFINRTFGGAAFMAPSLNIVIANPGDLSEDELNDAIIVSQSPIADGDATLVAGSTVRVTIKQP